MSLCWYRLRGSLLFRVANRLGMWQGGSRSELRLLGIFVLCRLQWQLVKVETVGTQRGRLGVIWTRTMHAHDASCHVVPVRMCALRMLVSHVEQMSEISQSSRTNAVELSIKSEHNLNLACEDSPQRAFFFCTFFSGLALLASTVHWLCCFLFLNAANRQLHSVFDSTKHIHCGGPATLSYCPFFPVLYH